MRSINLLTLLLIYISTINLTSSSPPPSSHHHLTTSSFIHTGCKTTLYPALCEASLSVYARSIHHSPRNLVHTALSLSFSRALYVSSFMLSSSSSSKSTHAFLSHCDCMQTWNDSVDCLRRAVKELNHLGRYGTAWYRWHLSNVQTWVSAALTDQSMCLNSLKEDVAFRRRIVQAAQVTSNALALVNGLQGPN